MDDGIATTAAPAGTEEPNFLRAVAHLAEVLAAVSSLHELGPAIDRVVCRLINVEYACLFLLDPGTERFRLVFSRGFSPEEARLAAETAWERHPGHVLRTGQILHVPDTDVDPDGVSCDSPRKVRARSRLFLPIVLNGRVVGTIGLSSSRPHAFDDFTRTVLSYAASLITVVFSRLEAEHLRQAEQQRMHAVVTDQTEMICRFQPDGTLTFANAAYCRCFGQTEREMLGRTFGQNVVAEDLPGLRAALAALGPKRPVATHENRVVVADAQIRWHRWTNHALFDDTGVLREYQSVGRDITDERLSRNLVDIERDLAFSLASTSDMREALGLVLQAAMRIERIDAGGVYLVEPDTGALRLVAHGGLSEDFVVAASRYERDSPQARMTAAGRAVVVSNIGEHRSELHSESMRQEGVRILVVTPVLCDGRVVAVLNLGSRSPVDLPPCIVEATATVAAHIGGIVARIESQSELARSRRNLSTLFDSIDDFLFVLDTSAVVRQVNAAVHHLLGWTDEDPIGRNFLMLHPERCRAEALFTVREMLEGRVASCPLPILTRDGREIPVDTKVARGTWDGHDALFGISRDVTRIRAAEGQLRRARDEMEAEVRQRTAELRRTNARLEREIDVRRGAERQLRHHQALLRQLASDASLAEERERRRIATEVHDRLGQSLTLARIRMDMARAAIPECDALGRFDELGGQLDQAIEDVHSLTFELSPPILYEVGFEAALEWLAEDVGRRAGLRQELRFGAVRVELPFDLKVLLFQVARELLLNVVKHAKAAYFRVETGQSRGRAFLAVIDDGRGFVPPETGEVRSRKGGFGLFSIRERMTHFGGRLQVETAPGSGTRISVDVPLRIRGAGGRKRYDANSAGR